MIDTQRMADIFVEVADTLVDDFDVLDFLHTLAHYAVEITDAAGVGIRLADARGGGLTHVAGVASDARLSELLAHPYDEGPCADSHLHGEPVRHLDLTSAGDRWPDFAPRAAELGVVSVHAFPMLLRNNNLGAVGIYGTSPRELAPLERMAIQGLTDIATIALLQERAISRAELVNEQLQHALDSRVVIEQAKGAVSRALGISVGDAFEILRTHARQRRVTLQLVAGEVINDASKLGSLTAVRPRPPT